MFIEELLASVNRFYAQWICMWAYTIYQDWEDHKIDLTKEDAALMYNLADIYSEEAEKWDRTLESIERRHQRYKRQKKFFWEKFTHEILRDASDVDRLIRKHRKELTEW